MLSFAVFFVLVTTVFWLMHVVVYAVVARVFLFTLSHWAWWCLVAAVIIMLANVGVRVYESWFTTGVYVVAMTWLGVLFLLLSATVVYEVFRLVSRGDQPVVLAVLYGAAMVASIYAFYNASQLTVRTYTIPLATIAAPVRLVQLSDIHVGTIHQQDFLERVVALTNAQQPDIVLITGDLFDGSAKIDTPDLVPLNQLVAPAYFSTGNHEAYEGLPQVRQALASLRLTLLENEATTAGELTIIGVNDRSSLPASTTLATMLAGLSYDHTKPTILMYHTPVEWEAARAAGIDLMLSGHTHNGQMWPFTLLVKRAFPYITGLYQDNMSSSDTYTNANLATKGDADINAYLHVSLGTGTWGPPMRLGSRNEVTVIDLVPGQGMLSSGDGGNEPPSH